MSNMLESYVLGLDPGLHGAWSVLDVNHRFVGAGVMPLRRIAKDQPQEVDPVALRNQIRAAARYLAPSLTVIEHVTPVAGSSRQSAFTFGRNFQALIDVCSLEGWKYVLCYSVTWKLEVLKKNSKDKQIAIDWVNETFRSSLPSPVTHDGIADATCMAEYAWRLNYGGLINVVR